MIVDCGGVGPYAHLFCGSQADPTGGQAEATAGKVQGYATNHGGPMLVGLMVVMLVFALLLRMAKRGVKGPGSGKNGAVLVRDLSAEARKDRAHDRANGLYFPNRDYL